MSAALFSLLSTAGSELRAEIMVEVRNNTNGRAYVCFSYHDVISDSRITRGWWEVPAFGNRTVRVNTDKSDFSWFIYNERGLAWGGEENDPDSEYRHVVRENFFVKEGWKPRGTKHMRIFLKKAQAGNKKYLIGLTTNTHNGKVDLKDE